MKKILLTAGIFASTFASVFAQKAPIVLYKDGANNLQLNYNTFSKFGEDSTNAPFEGTKQYKFDYVSKDWWGGNIEFKFATDVKDFSGYTYLEIAWKATGTKSDVLNLYLTDSSKVSSASIKVGAVGDEVGSYLVSKIPLSVIKGAGNLNLSIIKFLGFNINGGDPTAAGTFYIDNIQIVDDPNFVFDDTKVIYKGNTNKLNTFDKSPQITSTSSVTSGGPAFEGSKHYELAFKAKKSWGGYGLININSWDGDKQDYTGYKYLVLAVKGALVAPATLKMNFIDNTDGSGRSFVVANLPAGNSEYGDLIHIPLADSVKGNTTLDLSNIRHIRFEIGYVDSSATANIYLDNIVITKERISTVAVNDVEYFSNLSVSPNPSNGIFNITSDRSINTLVVTDYMGTVINAPLLNGNSIDLSNQKAGMYLVRISSGDQKITKKLIKE